MRYCRLDILLELFLLTIIKVNLIQRDLFICCIFHHVCKENTQKMSKLSQNRQTGDNRLTKQTRGKEGEERRDGRGGENQQAIISLIWSPY